MKILFISSGYTGIYEHFESWIVEELRKNHEVLYFQSKRGLRSLQYVTRTFHPELAFTLVGFKMPIHFIHWLQSQQVKTALWCTEDPFYIDQSIQFAPYYDFIFTIESETIKHYKKNGHEHVYLLPLATEPNIFKPKEIDDFYKSDVCIVGYPYPERIQLVHYLIQQTKYKIQLVGKWKKLLYPVLHHPNLSIHDNWVEPNIAANYYNGAKIVLNTHRPFNLRQNQNRTGVTNKSINNRTFDVACCQAFQLIEFKEDLPNFFKENEEIISYRTNEELLEKINYFMEKDEERQRIAANGRKRVLEEHTFKHRLDKLLEIVCNAFP